MEAERRLSAGRSPTTAVLGPTNTGKTHLAMERMLASPSGMIGFPLRLLARENYDRAVAAKGRDAVALITGEEKIAPPGARYFLCTVESMPLSRPVSFLAIDEIQMCADPDRGYVFTERLLHARGDDETMFLGAETIRPLLRRLTPNVQTITRPRFSTLAYAGPSKISRLPPRSAIVAFNLADVYSIAELIRRERGGAAIVLGALSPRTRNAQVSMYQAGDVDYLVATDAIGMGLNMDINHISFAATRKFDGRVRRDLTPAEMAQIAGRAGRHTRNGTFGSTAGIGALKPDMIDQIESHQFDPLKSIFWRNDVLELHSIASLKASLAQPPDRPGLARTRIADDERALTLLTRDPDIARRAAGREAVSLLWDVCQIPDFATMMTDGHARLLGVLYRYLANMNQEGRGRLPTDWVSRQVDHLNRVDGDIEAIMQRIAHIRIWTYIAQRPDWLEDSAGWQHRTRQIEDKLSDTLHERLVQRFVDRKISNLYARIRERKDLAAHVTSGDEVFVEGHFVGTLRGLHFVSEAPRAADGGRGAEKLIHAAATGALRTEIAQRVHQLESASDGVFDFNEVGQIVWHGAPVARLDAGASSLAPKIVLLANELLTTQAQTRIRNRLSRWLSARLLQDLNPLFTLSEGAFSGIACGLLYQVAEDLGSVSRQSVQAQIAGLSPSDRRALQQHGLRLGRYGVYFPSLLKPKPLRVRALLWAAHQKQRPTLPKNGVMSVSIDGGKNVLLCEATGFVRLGPRAVRIDLVERVLLQIERAMRRKTSIHPAQLSVLIGCPAKEVLEIVSALGYRARQENDGLWVDGRQPAVHRSRKKSRTVSSGLTARELSSPFARLRELRAVL